MDSVSDLNRVRRIHLSLAAFVGLMLLLTPGPASADRRYFLYTYSPFLDPTGEMELETWLTARTGKQDPTAGTHWEPRAEFEYAIHGRLGSAAYLNFDKQPGHDLKLTSPSLELIYRLSEPGKLAGDPALYLETTESGHELELETKLLLAHRRARWISGANVIADFEFRHDNAELLPSGRVLRKNFAGELAGGVAYEFGQHVSLGFEARCRSEHPNFGSQSAAFVAVGPNLNLEFGHAQFGIAIMPQLWGTPRSSGRQNLDDFERLQTRVILGLEL